MEEFSSTIMDDDLTSYETLDDTLSSSLQNIELTLLQKFRLRLFGKSFIKNIRLNNWTDALPIYAFRCPMHGLQISYPMGWEKKLICEECISHL